MDREGPQTNEGNGRGAQEPNVVQLGDWIGPRDELVPFGHRPQSRRGPKSVDALATEHSVLPAGTPSDPPPSAEDFWGERAAAIHDALQAPADQWPPADGWSPADQRLPADTGSEDGAPTGNARSRVRYPGRRPSSPRVQFPSPRASSPRVRFPSRRSSSLAIAASLVLIVLATLAVALNPLGAGTASRGTTGGSKIPLASVLSDGLPRALAHDVPHIGSSATTTRARVGSGNGAHRHATHTRAVSQRARGATPARSGRAVGPQPAAGSYTARVAPAPAAPTDTSVSPPAAVSSSATRSASTSAPVSATGASGALGPIQSPNG